MNKKAERGNRNLIIAAAALVLVVVALLLVWRLQTPKGQVGSKTVVVEVVHADGSTRDFKLKTDEAYLGKALVEGKVVEDNQGPFGLYILTADGETANEDNQEWWQITKNGEQLNTGADGTAIEDGDHFELTLTVGYE